MSLKGKLVTIILITLFAAFVVLPPSFKTKYFSFMGQYWTNLDIRRGLDLAGGSQLDYKIDLRDVKTKDKDNVIDGVINVMEKRVNSIGAKEPNIYRSEYGNESHVIVELAGVNDLEEAKAIVGKVVQLEFKEQAGQVDQNKKTEVMTDANQVLASLKSGTGASFEVMGQELAMESGKTFETKSAFLSEVPDYLKGVLPTMQSGQIFNSSLEAADSSYTVQDGKLVPTGGDSINLVKLVSTEQGLNSNNPSGSGAVAFATVAKEISANYEFKNIKESVLPANLKDDIKKMNIQQISDILTKDDGLYLLKLTTKKAAQEAKDEVKASHILIAYKGAQSAASEIVRTKEDAQKLAGEILSKAQKGEDFATLAKTYSDDPGSKTSGGDLGYFAKGSMVPAFETAVWNLKNNELAAVTETPFGFHVIKKIEARQTPATEAEYSYEQIMLPVTDKDKMAELEKKVKTDTKYTYSVIAFSTKPDEWKPATTKDGVALTGKYFKNADVSTEGGFNYVVNIEFTDEGAKIFEEITARLVGKPLAIFVGGQFISSPVIREKISAGKAMISGNFSAEEAYQLKRDLNTGAISAPIVLAGQQTVGATLGDEAVHNSLVAGLIGLMLVCIFMIIFYAMPGLLADIALIIYSLIVLTIVKFFGVVMTLAGIAALIMSIGIAVDANVLIFERIKEEIRKGKGIATAIDLGFQRAWSSIRDSNVSSIMTAVVLFWFGSSIIRGFALMLIIGILVSMFTAIFITRAFLHLFIHTKLGKKTIMYGVSEKQIKQ